MKLFVLYQFKTDRYRRSWGKGKKNGREFTTEGTEFTEEERNPRGRSELRPYMILGNGVGWGVFSAGSTFGSAAGVSAGLSIWVMRVVSVGCVAAGAGVGSGSSGLKAGASSTILGQRSSKDSRNSFL